MTNYINEFRDGEVFKKILNELKSYSGRTIKLMEVCGTHTMAISKFGLRSLLPENIELISGPGCPVCVTPINYINNAVELSENKNVIITTFGDMMRIPGSESNLLEKKAQGCNIQMVYSPLNALDIARKNPDKEVVFLSVGFETTTPVIALTVLNAKKENLKNFSVLTANKTMPQAMITLANDKDLALDGFILPGHVSAIIGTDFFSSLTYNYLKSGAIVGFEPLDLVYAINKLVKNISEGKNYFENLYKRVVSNEGNKKALEKMYEVFEPADAIWRGIGKIPSSGLSVKESYSEFDAQKKFDIEDKYYQEPQGCMCGEVLKGKCKPTDCRLFKKYCNPESPVGACMVSSEGTCAAYYKYVD